MVESPRAGENREDAWVIAIGDRLIRMVGTGEDSVRSFLHEAIDCLISEARISVRPMTAEEREAEDDEDSWPSDGSSGSR